MNFEFPADCELLLMFVFCSLSCDFEISDLFCGYVALGSISGGLFEGHIFSYLSFFAFIFVINKI